MKILHINAIYEKLSTGRLVMELSEYLNQKGDVSYNACVDLSSLSENCYRIGNRIDHVSHALLSRLTGKQAFFSHIETLKLLRYIGKINPDVVHLNNLHSNYINIKMLFDYLGKHNIPTVITLHDNWFYTGKCNYYIQYHCDRWREQCGNCPDVHYGNKSYFFDHSRRVLSVKKELYEKLPRLAVIGVSKWVTEDAQKSVLSSAKITRCIYNWIDLELYKPLDQAEIEIAKQKYGLTNSKIVLGVAAAWNKVKGIEIFHQLADMLPKDYKIVLVGDCTEIQNKHDGIIYWGKTDDVKQLSDFYNIADVFLNPTIQETFGKTTAEALACGTPVVALNSTATPELVGNDGNCGILVQKFDSTEFHIAVVEVLSNGKDYYKSSTRARAVSMFSKDKNIEQYRDIYREIVKG